MTRSLAPRLRRLEGAIGWQWVTLRQRSGAEVQVRTVSLVDAWLRVMLDGEAPNLPTNVSRFLATSVVTSRDGEFLRCLRDVCREQWFPSSSQAERDLVALRPDPPAPVPTTR